MKSSSFNIIVRLQRWMDSVPGQTFLNYAYSWGASIVILGALFKLTHLYGADIMLFIGMGTEVVVFFLSAFDRPFDRSSDDDLSEEPVDEKETEETAAAATPGGVAPSTIIIGGGGGAASGQQGSGEYTPGVAPAATAAATAQQGVGGGMAVVGGGGTAAIVAGAEEAANPELGDVTKSYVEKLKELTETLAKVEEQSRRMTTDSEEMVNLNRTLTGINTVYELQLKSISSQIGTIDQINEQTRKMAKQIEELNGVYSRMIKALTVNMKNAAQSAAGIDE